MLFGVIIPLAAYSICAVLLAIENGSRKELPDILSSEYTAYLGAIAFFCQLCSVFSFGIKQTLLNFLLCALFAAVIGTIVYRILWSVRMREMKKLPVFREVVDYCRKNAVQSVTVTHGNIEVSPGDLKFPAPPFADWYRDRKGRQSSESKEMQYFSKMLARKLGYRCRKCTEKKEEWDTTGGYKASGNSIYAEVRSHTYIEYEGYTLTPKK